MSSKVLISQILPDANLNSMPTEGVLKRITNAIMPPKDFVLKNSSGVLLNVVVSEVHEGDNTKLFHVKSGGLSAAGIMLAGPEVTIEKFEQTHERDIECFNGPINASTSTTIAGSGLHSFRIHAYYTKLDGNAKTIEVCNRLKRNNGMPFILMKKHVEAALIADELSMNANLRSGTIYKRSMNSNSIMNISNSNDSINISGNGKNKIKNKLMKVNANSIVFDDSPTEYFPPETSL